jgi:bifunctional polynucleotide phosphatase/kinase
MAASVSVASSASVNYKEASSGVNTVYQFVHGELKHNKCIAFDMDDTLISGAYTSLYQYPGAKAQLERMNAAGYNIIVISNQKKPDVKDNMVKAKIEAVIGFYGPIPMHFFCAREEDRYRKPDIGILDLIPKAYGKIEYYVGDAAGREGDHSDCDLEFAKRACIEFTTPEVYFNLYTTISRTVIPPFLKQGRIRFLTMILLCGYPASGKSTYAEKVLEDYVVVSRDKLKTMPKCAKLCEAELSRGHSVVVDNLNAKVADRKQFISVARKCGASVIVIHFRTTMRQAMAWNEERGKVGKKIPNIVYYKYRKEFELPCIGEGVDDIFSIL